MKRAAAKQHDLVSPDDTEMIASAAASDVDTSGTRARTSSAKNSVLIKLGGKEYRLRSDADEAWLQQVAGCVDQAMKTIGKRTDTVDSTDVALLTALNLAREVLRLREEVATRREQALPGGSLQALIEQVEDELTSANADGA